MKATHSGTCQVCGASQKLPDGVLSKHGYTTRWGFFSGICSGAGTVPEVVVRLRVEKAGRMQGWIDERQRFVDWQERRIAEWKPGKLVKVK